MSARRHKYPDIAREDYEAAVALSGGKNIMDALEIVAVLREFAEDDLTTNARLSLE
jgi:hypothetical protein